MRKTWSKTPSAASFAVGQGRFPQLDNRDSLWRLLVVITANKGDQQLAYTHRQKRGGGPVADPTGINRQGRLPMRRPSWNSSVLEPTPDFAAQVAEEYRRWLELLGDDTLRQVAVWKMEGYGTDEMAEKLGCSRRTVTRKLEAIRILWSDESAS